MHSSKLEFYEVFPAKKKFPQQKFIFTLKFIFHTLLIFPWENYNIYPAPIKKNIFADGSRNWLGCRLID